MKITHRERLPDHITDKMLRQAKGQMIARFTEAYPEMSVKLARHVLSKTKPTFFAAGEIIVDYQQTCDHVLFLIHGLISSSFFIGEEEKKLWYHTAGQFVIAVDSWYGQVPSEEKLTAVQDSLALAISKTDFEYLLNKHLAFNIPVRRITEMYFSIALKRTFLIHFDALNKYKFSLANHWEIVNSIPYYELAQMLGVARETISRIRNMKWKVISPEL